ncbi:putative FBD-associated F-box protein At5g22720 [Argentina anserina]|uniref:putative FBD-associated F-box protein At5g22720 n=1 Tax=Argentina anserina TaxID=57926 RepID=UPI0021768292|nr:putative FBD-associated F-box protein At5g22720 [Potentilla anserina]
MAERREVENDDNDDHNAMGVVPHLPNLVIHQILRYLPSKLAVRMSFLSKNWAGMWTSLPLIDLQEEIAFYDNIKFNMLEHTKFINFLVRYLELRDKNSPLEKLRLHMRYRDEDKTVLDRWLSFAAIKSIRELDNNLMSFTKYRYLHSYCFPLNILSAKSITALNLEYVKIIVDDTAERICFPSLKAVSLKHVSFNSTFFFNLIYRSLSIEYISMIACSGSTALPDDVLKFTSSSLKSLELSDSNYSIEVRAHVNLESFTLVSKLNIRGITLDRCRNLKYIKIHAPLLNRLDLLGCHDSMKATINAPNLIYLAFNGYMNLNFFEETVNLENGGIVAVRDRKPICKDESWKHFSTLRDFLNKGYGSCSTSLRLFVFDTG